MDVGDPADGWAAVASAIRARIAETGMLQTDLAARAGVSPATIRDITNNPRARRRSARTLAALSAALGWDPGYLAGILAGPPPADDVADLRAAVSVLQQRLDRLDVAHVLATTEPLDGIPLPDGGPHVAVQVRLQLDTWQRLDAAATAQGVDPRDLLARLVEGALPPET